MVIMSNIEKKIWGKILIFLGIYNKKNNDIIG